MANRKFRWTGRDRPTGCPIDAVSRAMQSGADREGTIRTMTRHRPDKERSGAYAQRFVRGSSGFAVIS
jgi:hypothetical protein